MFRDPQGKELMALNFKLASRLLLHFLVAWLGFCTYNLDAQTFLIDTFEQDNVGQEPTQWDHIKGNAFDKNPKSEDLKFREDYSLELSEIKLN